MMQLDMYLAVHLYVIFKSENEISHINTQGLLSNGLRAPEVTKYSRSSRIGLRVFWKRPSAERSGPRIGY